MSFEKSPTPESINVHEIIEKIEDFIGRATESNTKIPEDITATWENSLTILDSIKRNPRVTNKAEFIEDLDLKLKKLKSISQEEYDLIMNFVE